MLGVATSVGTMAQVYSANIVGYVNLDLPEGLSMIANPLNRMGGPNTINDVIKDAPNDTKVWIFGDAGWMSPIGYIADPAYAGWYDSSFELSTQELNPGEGMFIDMKAAGTITFVGEVPQGDLGRSLPVGLSIVSGLTPDGTTVVASGLPAEDEDVLWFYDNASGYSKYSYIADPAYAGWYDGGFNLVEVALAPGEAAFLNRLNATAPADWTRTFNVE